MEVRDGGMDWWYVVWCGMMLRDVGMERWCWRYGMVVWDGGMERWYGMVVWDDAKGCWYGGCCELEVSDGGVR